MFFSVMTCVMIEAQALLLSGANFRSTYDDDSVA